MDLLQLLSNVNGNTIINITTETVLPLLGGKKNPMKDRVMKVTTGTNCMVFQNKSVNGYAAMVQRRLAAEGKGDFQLGERKWGTRVPELPVVEHEGNMYMEVIVLRTGVVHYELDGKVIQPHEIQGFKDEYIGGEQGGLDNKVTIKCYKFDSLRAITIDKNTYTLRR